MPKEHRSLELTRNEFGLERIVFFSDAVVAIAITLLALDIRVPVVPPEAAAAQLPGLLAGLAPRFISLVTSFIIIGVYWLSHHHYFQFIERFDRSLILINLLFLLFIICVPFVTNLLGTYALVPLAYIVYSLTVAAIGACMYALWSYATTGHRLVDPKLDPGLIRVTSLRALFAPVIFLVSIPFALVNPMLAVLVWCLSPLTTFLVSRWVMSRRRSPARA